jgi:hypothetical protein
MIKKAFYDIKSSIVLCIIFAVSLNMLLGMGLWMLGIEDLSKFTLFRDAILGAGIGVVIFEVERVKRKRLAVVKVKNRQ